MLGEDVERVARDHRLLDLALAHPPRDDRALEQVGAELGEDPALRDLAELVAGAADPLQAAGDRLRRLDLDHEVDGAHVDPELERGGGDEAGELAGLQQLLDDRRAPRGRASRGGPASSTPFPAPRARSVLVPAVLGGRQLLLGLLVGQLVEALRQALGGAAVVDEDDRRGVLADELEQLRVDRGPDRARPGSGVERRLVGPGRCLRRLRFGAPESPRAASRPWRSGSAMSSTGTTICRSSSFGRSRRRRSRTRAAGRPGSRRPSRAAAGWPRARSAGRRGPPGPA